MSFELELSEKDEAAARFVVKLGKALQRALVTRKARGKLTQQDIARRLDVDRGRVNRCFSGFANLTAESIGELAWAIDAEPEISFKFEEQHGYSVKILEFESSGPRTFSARRTLTVGVQGADAHVWSIILPTNKHYSLHRSVDEPAAISAPKLVQAKENKWEATI